MEYSKTLSRDPLKIFYHGEPSDNLVHLQSLAQCFGISSEFIDVRVCGTLAGAMAEFISSDCTGAVLDLASLKDLGDTLELEKVTNLISRRDIALLLLATSGDRATNQMLQALTQGAVWRSESVRELSNVIFSREARAWNRELSAQSYLRNGSAGLTLSTSSRTGATTIMELDGAASFVHVSLEKARLFIWSTFEIMDAFRPLSTELEFERATDEYIPGIIFLRAAFGDRCWHNPQVGAGIVIDDPLLKKNYGFIKFSDLLGSARRHGFRVTLAFIPWNSWRSRAKQVRLFLDHRDCFNICAHGCDHTNNEYGSEDYDVMVAKNVIAAGRMERHRQKTGLSCEALMVCPQEQYSLQAMQAFADSGQFLALVNTSCVPRNLTSPQVCAADLLLPAQDSFFGFPVFKRHYWKDMSPFAMGLFLGKPAILVEHHEFFRDGCSGIEAFASQLAEMSPDAEWKPLSDIATSTHLRRRVSEKECGLRFFTNKFEFTHADHKPISYRLFKRLHATTAIERVLVNGEQTSFSRKEDTLALEVYADRPQSFDVQIETRLVKPARAYSRGFKYQSAVALRRVLSEFRDNTLSRNSFALKAGKYLIRDRQAWHE